MSMIFRRIGTVTLILGRRRMGTLWLIRRETPLLAVPSVAVPGGMESIVLANPSLLDEGIVRLIAVEERIYNERAFASEQGG